MGKFNHFCEAYGDGGEMVRMEVSVYGGETSPSSNGGETSPSRQAVRLSRGCEMSSSHKAVRLLYKNI